MAGDGLRCENWMPSSGLCGRKPVVAKKGHDNTPLCIQCAVLEARALDRDEARRQQKQNLPTIEEWWKAKSSLTSNSLAGSACRCCGTNLNDSYCSCSPRFLKQALSDSAKAQKLRNIIESHAMLGADPLHPLLKRELEVLDAQEEA